MLLTDKIKHIETPTYYYNLELLKETLQTVYNLSKSYHFQVHYAIKANANPVLLKIISQQGLGADCVSGNEIQRAIECGFSPDGIVYAGVGKTDSEITLALQHEIFCFNCESLQEIQVINEIAGQMGKKARIALRINPNVEAHTHHYITTGIEENKFGIYLYDMEHVIDEILHLPHIEWIGLHFHIGSQITDMTVFRGLCIRANEIQKKLQEQGFVLPHINFGGGLGIDYQNPEEKPIADFNAYFHTFSQFFEPLPHQQIHFELGRSIVANCGNLLTRVLYVKEGKNRKFIILDAGMNDLLRPALYQAFHKIENLCSNKPSNRYDIVGPICESADCFGKDICLPETQRGDLLAIRSCGAYGEVMASRYNLRDLPHIIFSK